METGSLFDDEQKVDTMINWSENIHNQHTTIYYPEDEDELSTIIKTCVKEKKKLRVIGSGHSISPMVCHSEEDLILISLKKFTIDPENISIDHDQMTVKVNAGWTFGQLQDELDKHLYLLPTQPASSAFTIGGMINLPVHGSCLGQSFLVEAAIGMELITHEGKKITKTIQDPDFQMYKYSFGLLGVVISVTFRMIRCLNTTSSAVTHKNFFQHGKVNHQLFAPIMERVITNCMKNKQCGVGTSLYHHAFIDLHNNKLVTLDWEIQETESLFRIDLPEAKEVKKSKLAQYFHSKIFPAYRKHKWYLKLLGNLSRGTIKGFVRLDCLDDRNMFWFTAGSCAYFMEYYIPIYREGEQFNLQNLYQALELLKEEVDAFTGKEFNLDLPVSLRFITSSPCSTLSPIYNEKKTVYVAIDLVCGAGNLYLQKDEIPTKYINLNLEFRKFFAVVEKKWQSLGGIPHVAKMQGFGDKDGDPFTDLKSMQLAINPKLKILLRHHAAPVFLNQHINKLLSEDS